MDHIDRDNKNTNKEEEKEDTANNEPYNTATKVEDSEANIKHNQEITKRTQKINKKLESDFKAKNEALSAAESGSHELNKFTCTIKNNGYNLLHSINQITSKLPADIIIENPEMKKKFREFRSSLIESRSMTIELIKNAMDMKPDCQMIIDIILQIRDKIIVNMEGNNKIKKDTFDIVNLQLKDRINSLKESGKNMKMVVANVDKSDE